MVLSSAVQPDAASASRMNAQKPHVQPEELSNLDGQNEDLVSKSALIPDSLRQSRKRQVGETGRMGDMVVSSCAWSMFRFSLKTRRYR